MTDSATVFSKRDWMDLLLSAARREYLLDDEEWAGIYRQVVGFKQAEPRWMMREATIIHGLYADGFEPWQAIRIVAAACNWPMENDK